MADIEKIASELLPGYIQGWYEEDVEVDPDRVGSIFANLMEKFEAEGWDATAQELRNRKMDPIVVCIEESYCQALDNEEAEAIYNAQQRKEQALQADADSVEQMELF